MLTFFMSAIGLEPASEDLLVREGLLAFASDRHYVEASKWLDPSGHEMWSINVVGGDEKASFLSSGVSLRPYAVREEQQP